MMEAHICISRCKIFKCTPTGIYPFISIHRLYIQIHKVEWISTVYYDYFEHKKIRYLSVLLYAVESLLYTFLLVYLKGYIPGLK